MLKTAHGLIVAASAALLAPLPAVAHPHMCVAFEPTVVIEKGAFTGIRQKWTFDEAYTTMAVEDLDTNKDGRFDRAELAELAKVNVEAMKELDYFTYPTQAGTAVKLADPTEYWLEHKDGILSLHFTLPFATPVPIDGKPLTLAVQDSSNFIAFGLPKAADPQASVQIAGAAQKSCRQKVEMPNPEELAVLNEIFNALGCKIAPPKAINVDCAGP
ncbi:MAG TPA: DUF1007 family protein [Hyphomicrobiaceae bacterium]|nr:DUF1007 family protein [Hyphomicrobiaceae bacterium]